MGKVSFKWFLSIYALYAKMDLAWLLRDTRFALLTIFSDILANLSAVIGVFLLAWRFDGIGSMSKYEVLFMLAYANMVFGILQMCDGYNTLYPSRIIGRGQWEHMFIMPLPFTVQLGVCISPFTCSGFLLSGIGMMVVAVIKLGLTLPWWWVLTLVANLLMSAVLVVALSYLSASLAFYAPVQCEEISDYVITGLNSVSSFPLSGMPLFLKLPLITLFPAGLLGWFPTMSLLGKQPIAALRVFPFILTILISLIAGYFFQKGFRYYVQKGINRYISVGHRS